MDTKWGVGIQGSGYIYIYIYILLCMGYIGIVEKKCDSNNLGFRVGGIKTFF